MGTIFKFFKMLISVLLGAIYLPLNMLLMKVSKAFQKARHEKDWFDMIFLGIILVPVWIIATVFSYPYEILVENAH